MTSYPEAFGREIWPTQALVVSRIRRAYVANLPLLKNAQIQNMQ